MHSSVSTPHRPQSNIWLLGKTFLHVSGVNRQPYVTAPPPDSVCAFDYFTSAKVALTLAAHLHIWTGDDKQEETDFGFLVIALSSPKHHPSQNWVQGSRHLPTGATPPVNGGEELHTKS